MIKISTAVKVFASQLARHLTLVFTGNVFAAGLGFLSVLIISRSITVSDFGLFNMAISVILVTSRFASLGLNTSMIKFVSSYLGENKTGEAAEVLRVVLIARIISASILALVIFSTAPLISVKVFHLPQLVPLIKIAAFGVFFVPLFVYVKSALYSYKMFKKYVSLQIMVDIAKVLALIILLFSLKLTVSTAVGVFAIIPLLGIFYGISQIKHKLFLLGKSTKNLVRHLLSYSKWTFMIIACRSATPYISIFIIARMLDIKTVGIYALALNLTYIFPILIRSLTSVLLPEASRFTKITQFKKYLRGSLKALLYAGILILPFLFFSRKIILFFFGSRYIDSVGIFNWLLVSFVFQASSSTTRSALYALHKPNVVAFVDMFRLIATVPGCYFLIPSLGFLAPAIVALVVNLSAFIFLTTYTFRHIKTEKAVLSFTDIQLEPLQN